MKSNITINLEKLLLIHTRKLGTFQCFEVTIGNQGKERVDFITFDTNNIFRFYEIKSTVTDFNSTSKHTFLGHYNYYVMPVSVYNEVKSQIPEGVGVIVFPYSCSELNKTLTKRDLYRLRLESIKKASKQELSKETAKVNYWSMFRSLFRDASKYYDYSHGR